MKSNKNIQRGFGRRLMTKLLSRFLPGLIAVISCTSLPAKAELVDINVFHFTQIVVAPVGGPVIYTSSVDSGFIGYDFALDQGSAELNWSTSLFGPSSLHDLVLTRNADNSLHVDGLLDAFSSTNMPVTGDWAVSFDYDDINDVTTYTVTSLPIPGTGESGLLVVNGAAQGLRIDFTGQFSYLAFVFNDPLPIQTVPLPAALWLLLSGIGVILFSGRRLQFTSQAA